MKKLMIGDKVIEIDESAIKQLSDDELDDACGGAGTSRPYGRLVCDICSFKSWWNFRSSEVIYLEQFHKQQGCYGTLRVELEYFDSDPNLITD
jgi:hypothetical protein